MYANTEGNNSMISFVNCTVSSNFASVGSGELYAVVCEGCCDDVFCPCPYLRCCTGGGVWAEAEGSNTLISFVNCTVSNNTSSEGNG